MKLKTKLILLLLVLTMLPISLLAWLSYQNGKKALRDAIGNELVGVAQGTMHNIEQELIGLSRNVKSWARLEVMQEVLTDDADWRISSVLSDFKKNYMVYADIYCFNQKGNIIASSNSGVIGKSYPYNPCFKEAMAGKSVVHDLKLSDLSQTYTIDFAVPILAAYDNTRVIGVLSAELKQEQLDTITNSVKFYEGPQTPSRYILLIDREGLIMAGPYFKINREKFPGKNLFSENKSIRYLVSLNNAGYTIGTNDKREDCLYGYVPQKGFGDFLSLGWGVLVTKTAKEAFSPIDILQKQILLLGIIIFLITAVLLTISIVRMVINPVQELLKGSQKLAKGELDYRVKVKKRDEIGELASSFNQMAAELESSIDKLKQAYENLKQAQGQLIQSGKLAAIGELGSGVAHELNNPLTGILGYAQHILEKTKRTDFNADDFKACTRQMEYIEKEGQRCKNIVQGLLKFSRKSHDKFELLNVNNVIEDTLALVGHQLAMNNINIVKELVPDLKEINGNGNQLQQVFTNIILNAQQAMSDKGELRIVTRNDDNGIKIEFADTGCGIPKENLSRIFDPFFTTKKDWRGTGLGLSISYNIIHDHNGSISVRSEAGKGSIFTISLPVKVEDKP